MEDLTDLLGQFQVSSIAAFDKDALRAPLQGFLHGHGRVDTKAPGFIRGRGDNAPSGKPADDDGSVAVFWMIQLLNGGKECVPISTCMIQRGLLEETGFIGESRRL